MDNRENNEEIFHSDVLNEIITLNVGGQIFQTTRDTIQKQNSMLSSMINSEREWKPSIVDKAGIIFIDRDANCFRQILHYLRTEEVHVENTVELKELLGEAKYYGLANLETILEEELKKITEREALKGKLQMQGNNMHYQWITTQSKKLYLALSRSPNAVQYANEDAVKVIQGPMRCVINGKPSELYYRCINCGNMFIYHENGKQACNLSSPHFTYNDATGKIPTKI